MDQELPNWMGVLSFRVSRLFSIASSKTVSKNCNDFLRFQIFEGRFFRALAYSTPDENAIPIKKTNKSLKVPDCSKTHVSLEQSRWKLSEKSLKVFHKSKRLTLIDKILLQHLKMVFYTHCKEPTDIVWFRKDIWLIAHIRKLLFE